MAVPEATDDSTPRHGLHVVCQEGDGPQIVIVHGGLDRASSFGRVARQLRGHRLIRYDRRGYGRSRAAGTASLEGHSQDLIEVMGDRPSVLVGHSLGGVVCLLAATRRPELVTTVIAYEAPTPWLDWWPGGHAPPRDPGDEAEAFMRRMIGDDLWQRLPERTRSDRRAEGPALRLDMASIRGPGAPLDVSVFPVPLISAAGSESTWWHLRGAQALAEAAPQGSYEEITGAGHGIHLTHARLFSELIARVVPRSGSSA